MNYKGDYYLNGMSSRVVGALLAAVCAATLLAGCGSGTNSYRTNIHGGYDAYRQDGALGYTNSNPNLPNRMQSTNYGSDQKFIGQILEPFADIEDIQLEFNGDQLNVDLKVKKAMTDEQIRKLRMDAQSAVQFNMPRYHVHVKADRSK